jgi:PAS domain S-box-containing protein
MTSSFRSDASANKGRLGVLTAIFGSPPSDMIVDRRIHEYKRQIPPVNLSLAFTTGFLFLTVHPSMLGYFTAAYVFYVAFAALQANSWRKLSPTTMTAAEKRAFLSKTSVLAVFQSCVCTLVAIALFELSTPEHRIIVTAWVAFCAFGGAVSLAADRNSSRRVIAIIVGPYAARLMVENDPTLVALGVMLTLAAVVGARLLARQDLLIREVCREKEENAAAEKHARETLRAFMEMASDWAWETDADYRLTYMSPNIDKLIGRTAEEILGCGISDVFDEKFYGGPHEERDILRDALYGRKNLRNFQYDVFDRDGAKRVIKTTLRHHYNDDGVYLGVRGWTKDVTERITNLKKLADSERRFQDFAESASDWMWEADADLRYTYFSERADSVTGVPHFAFIGLKMGESRGAAAEFEKERHADALSQRLAFKDELSELPLPDGESIWIARSGKPVFAPDGAFQGYRGVCRDVTTEMRARREVEASRALLQQANDRLEKLVAERTFELQRRTDLLGEVIESMADGLVVFSDDYVIETVNSKAAALSGLPSAAWAPGRRIVDILEIGLRHGLYSYESLEDYDRAMTLSLRETGVFTTLRQQKDGRAVVEKVRRRPCGGYVVSYNDITDLKAREKALELMSAELAEARDAAEAANRAKSSFLANMSHEIRTPMNGVIGMATLLLEAGVNARQREMAQIIVNSGENLLNIINDILDFSKIEAGKMKIAAEPYDLRTTIEDITALLGPQAEDKGLELALRYQPTLGAHFIGDPGRLRQIVINLIGNAVKFTDTGHVLVSVGGKRRGETAEIDIVVEDTGCGIPQDKLKSIFNAFEQADGSSARRHDGTGLGLAITQKLVEAMGGEIFANSEVGKGTRFHLRWPAIIDASASAIVPSAKDLVGARALIVDDIAVNRDILVEQLAAWGIEAVACASAAEAFASAVEASGRQRGFDLCILDQQMPGTDGIELARRLRLNAQTTKTPLILLTSAGRKGAPEEQADALFDAYLVKPARSSMLLDAIVASLQGRAASIASAAAESMCARSEPDTASTLSGIEVLVAEDNVVNQMVITAMLENVGARASIASNGAEAVERYRDATFAVVLMDISMPEMDGVAATAAIRRIEAERGTWTPIIGVTAHAMEEDRIRCVAAGMDDYLPKPVKPDLLRRMIERWASARVEGKPSAGVA